MPARQEGQLGEAGRPGASHGTVTTQSRLKFELYIHTDFSIPKVFFDYTIRNYQNDVGNVFFSH